MDYSGDLPVNIDNIFEKYSDCVSFTFGSVTTNYTDLNLRSSAISSKIESLGVVTGDVVGVHLDRSIDFVSAVLGIMKAGAVFLPLPTTGVTHESLRYMIEDSDAKLIIGQTENSTGDFSNVDYLSVNLIVDDPEKIRQFGTIAASRPTAIFYTSGSTGKPKGVLISYSGLQSRLPPNSLKDDLSSSDVYLWKSNIGFSSILREIFWPLLTGASAAIVPQGEERDLMSMIGVARKFNVTVMHLVPTQLRALIQIGAFRNLESLRHLIVGGEVLSDKTPDLFFEQSNAHLHQIYGSTEATTATQHTFDRNRSDPSTSIGTQANLNTFVLDEYLNPVKAGEVGEIYVGGPGLALKYLNNIELTNLKFLYSELNKSGDGRIFKTGDFARLNNDGSLNYVGRTDEQVKIRGHRVELQAIRSVLEDMPFVESAEVLCITEAGNATLTAYFIPKSSAPLPTLQEITSTLVRLVPEYMIPTVFVPVDNYPLDNYGKLDVAELQKLNRNSLQPVLDSLENKNKVELIVADIWKEELNLDMIGVSDDFFLVGGNSIIALSIVRQVTVKTGADIRVVTLFDNPTIAGMAQIISEMNP